MSQLGDFSWRERMKPDTAVRSVAQLAQFMGSHHEFYRMLIELLAAADAGQLAALREAFPAEAATYRVWSAMLAPPTAEDLEARAVAELAEELAAELSLPREPATGLGTIYPFPGGLLILKREPPAN